MRIFLLALPIWRAISAWVVALCTPSSLLREMANLPYRGAPVVLSGKGRIQGQPAQTLREAMRNRQRLARAMEHNRP